MDLTMTSRVSWWWLHVLLLVILQHTWVSSQEPSPTSETYWGNVTTGPDPYSITSEETTGTLNTTLETNPSIITTRPDRAYTTSNETSRTPNTTLETYWDNVTTGPDLNSITSEETTGTSNTTLETSSSNITTSPDLVSITSNETSRIPSTPYWGNVTTGPDLYSITSEETPNTTLETHPSNITTTPDLVYITSIETSRTPNSTLQTYWGNVTTGTVTSEETPSITLETYLEDTSRTSNYTLGTYTTNATTGPDYVSEETSRTPTTALDSYSSVTEETSATPNITEETYPRNVTTEADLMDISAETSGATSTSLEPLHSYVTTGLTLDYISEETTVIPNNTVEMERTSYTDVTKSPDLIYTPTIVLNATLQTGGSSYISALYCVQDDDCPPFTMCTELGGLYMCQCHLGSYFHHELGCVTVRTFPARIPVSVLYWDENTTEHRNNEDKMRYKEPVQLLRVGHLFQNVLGHIPGYLSTLVTDIQLDEGLVTIVHSFSTLYAVTEEDVWGALTVSPLICTEPHSGCVSPLTYDDYQGLSLCDFNICDSSSSDCHAHEGLVTCECHGGYYKFSPTDRSCRACDSGFQRTENGCERCPIGFGGFNCEEPYLLVVIVESCVVCVLVVSLITLLVFYFRRKEPQKPTFMDSIVLGVPTDQPSLRLPRAQFSWRREWEWNNPPEKVEADIHQEAASPDGPIIPMKTFGDPARFSAPNSYHGRHNLSFISD